MSKDKLGSDTPGNDNSLRSVVRLDQHRGLAAQKAADQRRYASEVESDQEASRRRRAALERAMFAGPAGSWPEVADRAAYLLRHYAEEPYAKDPSFRRMISGVLDDLARLGAETRGS